MNKRLAIGLMAIAFSLGGIAGACIVLHEWDITAARDIAARQADTADWKKITDDTLGTAREFRDQLDACRAQFEQSTVLYGRNATQVNLGPFAGGLIPPVRFTSSEDGNLAPQWLIPAKVKPIFLGDPRRITYYYFDLKTKRLDGPFLPDTPSSMKAGGE